MVSKESSEQGTVFTPIIVVKLWIETNSDGKPRQGRGYSCEASR